MAKKTIVRPEILYIMQELESMFRCEIIPEYKFCDSRRWRADFAILHKKILIEVEGGVFTNGRHTRGAGYTKDIEKYNEAQILGFKVYRFTYQQINNGYFKAFIERIEKPLTPVE